MDKKMSTTKKKGGIKMTNKIDDQINYVCNSCETSHDDEQDAQACCIVDEVQV